MICLDEAFRQSPAWQPLQACSTSQSTRSILPFHIFKTQQHSDYSSHVSGRFSVTENNLYSPKPCGS